MAPQPQTIDEALDPERANQSAPMNFLGGFIRGGLIGALVIGVGALAVTAGMAALSTAGLTAAFTGAGLTSTLTTIAAAAGIGGLTLGAASGAARAAGMVGVANGFQLGRQTERGEMMMAMEQEAQMMMSQGKGPKQALDFSGMPDHPANQVRGEKIAQGQFTSAALAREGQQAEAVR